jgi:eukaryotic-like serine/threonine-protein kinase
MGEVYRARDTRLGRDVALKVLPSGFATDPERVARFHREAQVLAALNHPHIAAIHGLEDAGGSQVLVLELVDGETLASRLKRGPLPIDEALALARQIADALGAAHEKGIIHRDLKPANIALSSQDQVKLLDFGLARVFEPSAGSDISNSPTLTFQATQVGVVLGTAAYMSPEQAKGRVADKRADIFSFGCVLYEMLAARRVFEGEDVSDTLAAVLRSDPDWSLLPSSTPVAIRRLIQGCLVKDRKERIGDIAVAVYTLREAAVTVPDTPAPARPNQRSLSGAFWVGIAGLVLGATSAMLVTGVRQTNTPRVEPAVRFNVSVPNDQIIPEVVRRRHMVALSPDGSRLAYIANDQIYMRPLDALEAVPVRGSHEQPIDLSFSPDSQWLAYYATGKLKKIPVGGGAAITLADAPAPFGIMWSGNRILFGAGALGILEVPAIGGEAKTLVAKDKDEKTAYHGPQLLPDGKSILFTVADASLNWSTASIVVQSLETGQRTTLLRGGTDARYLPSGHLVYARDGVLIASAMSLDPPALTGGAVAMVDSLAQANGITGAAHFSVSDSGSLVHLPSSLGVTTNVAWRTRHGTETAIATPPRAYDQPRLSPDGRRMALHATDQDNDIWIWDFVGETLTRLTFEPGLDTFPVWTGDGKRIVYTSSRSDGMNFFWKAADGTGQAEALLREPPPSNGALVGNCMTPDGKFLIFSIGTPSNVMRLSLDGAHQISPVLTDPRYAERGASISPDGRFIAYQSDESGAFQIYVRPYPNVDAGRWQLSGEGATHPQWSPKGNELFYADSAGRVLGVPIDTRGGFSFGRPVNVFDFSDRPSSVYRNHDVASDGQRFVVVKEAVRSRTTTQFVVTLKWFDELAKRAPVK